MTWGYARETWAMKGKDMARLERTERMIVRGYLVFTKIGLRKDFL